jgi:hypothetical protein
MRQRIVGVVILNGGRSSLLLFPLVWLCVGAVWRCELWCLARECYMFWSLVVLFRSVRKCACVRLMTFVLDWMLVRILLIISLRLTLMLSPRVHSVFSFHVFWLHFLRISHITTHTPHPTCHYTISHHNAHPTLHMPLHLNTPNYFPLIAPV